MTRFAMGSCAVVCLVFLFSACRPGDDGRADGTDGASAAPQGTASSHAEATPSNGRGAAATDASETGPSGARGRALDPELLRLRASLERFRDVGVALAEGYVPDPMNMCETAEVMGFSRELGAMGIHYFRPDLLQISATEPRVDGTGIHTDFSEPSVLIYEPQVDGSLELVAVENLAFRRAWEEAGHAEPPSFMGVPYDYMADDPATDPDEGHFFEPHYDRHVWIFRENPHGVFAQFNPAVTCEHHQGGTPHGH